jgi:hypothetical protein
MATVSTAKQGAAIGSSLYTVTETSKAPTAVSMDTSSGDIIMIEIDNTANSVASYLNLYDVAGGGTVTVGTTDESYVFMAPASSRITYACPEGAEYASGLWATVVSSPGSANGPGSTVTAYILVNT